MITATFDSPDCTTCRETENIGVGGEKKLHIEIIITETLHNFFTETENNIPQTCH